MTRRIALVGLSWIAADLAAAASDPTLGTSIPYSHASAVAAIPDLEIVAGCDISEAARTTFLDRWIGRYPGLKVYADYREMLETERPELVAVVTPDHLHRDDERQLHPALVPRVRRGPPAHARGRDRPAFPGDP